MAFSAFLSRKRKKSENLLIAAASTIGVLKDATDSLPFLSVATGIALIIVKTLLAVTENVEACKATAERIVQVYLTIADTFRDIDANDIPPHTSRRIASLQGCLEGLRHRVDKLASRSKLYRYLIPERTKTDLANINADLDECVQLFQISSLISLQLQTEQISSRALRPVEDVAPECPLILRKDFELFDLVLSSTGAFDVYTGTYGNKLIAIKCFKGHEAKSQWALHLEHDRRDIHPNIVTVIGKSAHSESMPYVVYGGIRGNTEYRLATLLQSDLEGVVSACISLIYGLSAGLLRLNEQGILPRAENIHAFLGPGGRTILSIDWSEAKDDEGSTSSCTLLDVFDNIASRVYQAANRLRYDHWKPEPAAETELIEEASSARQQTATNTTSSEAQNSERGLVWKSEVPVGWDLVCVRDNAMRLHQQQLAGVALAVPSRRYRDSRSANRWDRAQEEVTFSACVVDYKIIWRIKLTSCYLRQVRHVFTKCGHYRPMPDEIIQCNSRNCRFSPSHPDWCKPPQCLRTCRQYRSFPQQYMAKINSYCPACSQAGPLDSCPIRTPSPIRPPEVAKPARARSFPLSDDQLSRMQAQQDREFEVKKAEINA